jgi:hypothetical protein
MADARWFLEIQSKPPKYALQDKAERRVIEAQTPEEILAIIEEKSGHQDSLAQRAPSE